MAVLLGRSISVVHRRRLVILPLLVLQGRVSVSVLRGGVQVTPYYSDDSVTIYHGDCREILPTLETDALVMADPPYGVNERTERAKAGRGRSPYALMIARDFPRVHGDDQPFDPSHLLHYKRLVLWGANHYADRLPPSASWIVWDKLDGLTSKRELGFNDNGDCELAWTNLGGPVRIIPHRWVGLILATEKERHQHPTQKPVAVMARIISAYSKPGDLIIAPYMGSGPELVAAKALGRRAIGIEVSEEYCKVAATRCSQETLGLLDTDVTDAELTVALLQGRVDQDDNGDLVISEEPAA